MLFPPGILKKLGFNAFNPSINSTRIPFGASLYVGGNRLIMLKLIAPPEESYSRTKVLSLLGAATVGWSVYECSTHFPDAHLEGMSRLTNVWFERADCNLTVNFPV